MKNYIRPMLTMVAILIAYLVLLVACKNEETPDAEVSLTEVSFDMSVAQLSASNGRIAEAEDCELEEAIFALVVVEDASGETFEARLPIRLFPQIDLIQTGPMQLPADLQPREYCLVTFEVYGPEEQLIAMLPDPSSAMSLFVDPDRCFRVTPFEKPRVRVELLCANWDQFLPFPVGFPLFDLALVKKQRLCLFADQCLPDQGDIVASLMVRIADQNGIVVSEGMNFMEDNTNNPNAISFGGLICIFVPDREDIPNDEEFIDVIVKIGEEPNVHVVLLRMSIEEVLALQDAGDDRNPTQFVLLEADCEDPGVVVVINPDPGPTPRPCPPNDPRCNFDDPGTGDRPDLVTRVAYVNGSNQCPTGAGSCTLQAMVTVRNNGLAPAGASSLQVAFDPGLANIVTMAVPALNPGEEWTQTITSNPGNNCFDPDCQICAEADINGDVSESNETNNEACTDIPG
ncbi:MAG: CARDB domain-containing protein [Bacteroidota bacterium]